VASRAPGAVPKPSSSTGGFARLCFGWVFADDCLSGQESQEYWISFVLADLRSIAGDIGFGGTGAFAGCACPVLPSRVQRWLGLRLQSFFSAGFFSPGFFKAVLASNKFRLPRRILSTLPPPQKPLPNVV